MPPATAASPYISPILRTRRVAADEPLPLPLPVPLAAAAAAEVAAAPSPPKPVYTAPPDAVDAAAFVAEAVDVVIVEVLTRTGL